MLSKLVVYLFAVRLSRYKRRFNSILFGHWLLLLVVVVVVVTTRTAAAAVLLRVLPGGWRCREQLGQRLPPGGGAARLPHGHDRQRGRRER